MCHALYISLTLLEFTNCIIKNIRKCGITTIMRKKILLFVFVVIIIAFFIDFSIKHSWDLNAHIENEAESLMPAESVFSETTVVPEVHDEDLQKETETFDFKEVQTQTEPEENFVAEETTNETVSEPEPAVVVEHIAVTGISLTTYNVTLSVGHQTMPIVTMQPYNATDKGEIWQSSDTSVATVDYLGNIKGVNVGNCVVTVTSTDNSAVSAYVNVTVIPEAECTYIDGILIANKTYPLPQSYAPGWDPEASAQLNVMFNEASREGIRLFVKSGYRSYIDQKIVYNGYVKRDGQQAADTYSARPGHSEHQTGLAFDLNSLSVSFENTPEGKWLAENCYKYGFIIRYPKGKEHITGYMYEPWHVRYLGIEKAKEVYESGLCLEEFLGITSVYSY